MSDRPQSIPPSQSPPPSHLGWEDDAAFRHIFLFRFEEQDRAALRRVGDMLQTYVLEAARDYGPDLQDVPPIAAELRAAAADLRTMWGFFTMLEVEGEDTHRGHSGGRLTDFAGILAAEMTRLAELIEGEVRL
jgi:hypothetical protein